SMLRFLVLLALSLAVHLQPVIAQSDPGAALQAPAGMRLAQIQKLDELPNVDGLEKNWVVSDLSLSNFYLARFVTAGLVEGSEEEARSSRFGIFYRGENPGSSNNGKWLVPPNGSGLYPINLGAALVRKPGTSEWLSFNIISGKTTKVGAGEVAVMDVMHPASLGTGAWRPQQFYHAWGPVRQYYLSTDDNGQTQTVQFLYYNPEKKAIRAWFPIENVLSRSNPQNLVPVQMLAKRDYLVRRWDGSNVTEGLTGGLDYVEGITMLIPIFSTKYPGQFAETAPYRTLVRVIDAERQLYDPVDSVHKWRRSEKDPVSSTGYKFLGRRPVGRSVGIETKAVPLELYADNGYAEVWQTPNGIRLAPVFGDFYNGTEYIPYVGSTGIGGGGEKNARYVLLEHIDIPASSRNSRAPYRMASGIRAFHADGSVDVWTRMVYGVAPETKREFVLMNDERLPSREAALAFEAKLFTDEGRLAFGKEQRRRWDVAETEKWERVRQADLAKLSPEQRESLRWAKIHEERRQQEEVRLKGLIDTRLAQRDWAGAMALTDERYGYGLKAYAAGAVIDGGGASFVSNDDARYAIRILNDEPFKSNKFHALLLQRVPPQVRSAPSGPWTGAPDRSGASSSGSSTSNPIADARARSRDDYNSGKTSQYLCSSSTFCN
ncbi:MAG: hypothetical protein WAT93_12340, partial [Pontixanthobacter sp.]